MAQIRAAKRRRVDAVPEHHVVDRHLRIATAVVNAQEPNAASTSVAPGEVPLDFNFPVIPYTYTPPPEGQPTSVQSPEVQTIVPTPATQAPAIQQTTIIPQNTVVPVAQPSPVIVPQNSVAPAVQQTSIIPQNTVVPVAQPSPVIVPQNSVVPAVQQTSIIPQNTVVPVAQPTSVIVPQNTVVPAPQQQTIIPQNTVIPAAQPTSVVPRVQQTTIIPQNTVVPAVPQSIRPQNTIAPAAEPTTVVPVAQPTTIIPQNSVMPVNQPSIIPAQPSSIAPAAQSNPSVPLATTFIATTSGYAAIVPIPAPTSAPLPVPVSSSTMSTQLKSGSTTVEAQQGLPSIAAAMSPEAEATISANKATTKILISCGTIAGVLVLIFLMLVLYRWRNGHKPFSSLLSWAKPTDEEEEDDLRPYSAPIPAFAPIDPHFSTYQKPIWEVNSSDSSLPQQQATTFTAALPNNVRPMALNHQGMPTAARPVVYGHQAMPSQSRFPPPNKINYATPEVEPKLYYRNPFSDKSDTQVNVRVDEVEATPSESSLEVPIIGPPTDDFRSFCEPPPRNESLGPRMEMLSSDSEWSWTNPRLAPQPGQPNARARKRMTASTASELRYTTVDGWVGQQTNRMVEYQIEQLFDDALEGRPRPGSMTASPVSPAPVAAAVMPLYVPEKYKEQGMQRMMDNDSRDNLVAQPRPVAEPQMSMLRKMGVAATSLYENLARGRYNP